MQDLGWSYDGTILVSVGLDSKVVVWSGHTFEKLKTLSNHQSHVKGITFDPANKYFATASDDRTIKIFRFTSPGPNSTSHDQMNNFVLESTISAPFVNSPLTTYFRRCSWSPEGMHIAAANAVNGPVSAIAIIDRGQWGGDTTLIGHEGPVEVCAFSPRLYGDNPGSKELTDGQPGSGYTTVIACAGADKSLSLWSTSNPRPLLVMQDLANKPICDLAWSPDGMNLYVTALDGSILVVMFEEGELGYPKSIEENERSLTKYGTGRKGAGVIETPEALLLEERSKAGELKGVEGRMGALMGHPNSSQPQINGTAKVNGVLDDTIIVNGHSETTTAEIAGQSKADVNQAKLERLKNRVEITKDGKKRIKPLLVSGAVGAESSLPQTRLVNASTAVLASDAPQAVLDLSKPFDGLPKGGLAALLLGNKRKFAQIDGEEDGQTEERVATTNQKGTTAILVNGPDGLLPAQHQPATVGQEKTPDFIRPAVINPVLSLSQVRLAVPKIRAHIVQGLDPLGDPAEVSADSRTRADFIFEARNPGVASLTGRAQDREPCRITLTRRDQPLWQDYLQRTVLLVTGTKMFWAAADEAGCVYIWSPAGRRLVSALQMEAQPVMLASSQHWLLCITAVGMCYVWNVKTMSSPHPPVSLASVLDVAIHTLTSHPTNAPAVTNARLNSEGRIVVTLSNGEGYAYSPQMYVWQRLSEVWWAVGSQYWNTTGDSSTGPLQKNSAQAVDVSAGIIPWLERNTTTETLLRGRAYFLQRLIKILLSREGFEGFEAGTSIAHLENRIAAALMLGSKGEFRLYLLMYAKRLGAEGLRLKVEELLRTLLGGILEDTDSPENGYSAFKANPNAVAERTWDSDEVKICGWEREELLKDVVLLLGKLSDP